MTTRVEVLCHRCGFPARRGKVPIIWPSGEGKNGRAAFCSLHCIEATVAGRHVLPEELRDIHLAAEEWEAN